MPLPPLGLPLVSTPAKVLATTIVELLPLAGGNHRNFVIWAVAPGGIVDGVDVKAGLGGFTGQLAQALAEFFLESMRDKPRDFWVAWAAIVCSIRSKSTPVVLGTVSPK